MKGRIFLYLHSGRKRQTLPQCPRPLQAGWLARDPTRDLAATRPGPWAHRPSRAPDPAPWDLLRPPGSTTCLFHAGARATAPPVTVPSRDGPAAQGCGLGARVGGASAPSPFSPGRGAGRGGGGVEAGPRAPPTSTAYAPPALLPPPLLPPSPPPLSPLPSSPLPSSSLPAARPRTAPSRPRALSRPLLPAPTPRASPPRPLPAPPLRARPPGRQRRALRRGRGAGRRRGGRCGPARGAEAEPSRAGPVHGPRPPCGGCGAWRTWCSSAPSPRACR